MTVSEFVAKWRQSELTERSASQQHFLDLCEVFGHSKPAEADPTGQSYTFEKGAEKQGGGKGWADVWKKGYFGWEYKGKHKNLDTAYDQLLQYREALENPPLLIVCNMDRIVIRTNFTATPTQIYDIPLSELDTPRNIEIMRRLFFEPEKLRPGITSEAITTDVARRLGEIAQSLRGRDFDPEAVAQFLDRIVFCLFAEDVNLLPEKLFSRIVNNSNRDPKRFAKLIGQLFDAMAEGGDFGADIIRHFNGNLFVQSPALELTPEEMDSIKEAAKQDWSAVDPSIFGTLFERGLNPEKRSQLGAQYTSREDIETLIEPVIMQPLRREWKELQQRVDELLAKANEEFASAIKKLVTREARDKLVNRLYGEPRALLRQFLERLGELKVLDPACGSGNFLYVTLQKLKDLEKEVSVYASDNRLGTFLPKVGPWQFFGIEKNTYAFDLAQTTIWIGYLQWIRANGYGTPPDPILRPMDNFWNMDAILDLSHPENPKEPEWPEADFIVGNPPFLGGKKMRSELGGDYVNELFTLWKGRVRSESDLCCYWFEKARKQIEEGRAKYAGLLATQGIRGGVNRGVLKRIKNSGDIFFAQSDRPWILNGASVHVSMVGFDNGTERQKLLDGSLVTKINPDLTTGTDVTTAARIAQNRGIAFQGPVKVGKFDIPEEMARDFLLSPNPHRRPNSDILYRLVNGKDMTGRPKGSWIIDFGVMSMDESSKYEAPFEYVERIIKPKRIKNPDKQRREYWWRLGRSGAEWKAATKGLLQNIFTPRVSKHRFYAWFEGVTLPDSAVVGFASSDYYTFGLLHSRIHEVWARAQGTQVRERESGFRYTPRSCAETFPFPNPTEEQRASIVEFAKELDNLRNEWLNPTEWTREYVLEFPGSVDGPWERFVSDPDERGIGVVRYPRFIPIDKATAKQLAKRTLTNLYNQRPTWLDTAHKRLDETAFAAYGWSSAMSDEDIKRELLKMNLEREAAIESGIEDNELDEDAEEDE